ncbi:MAG: DNA polymerase III subunit [Chitinispirillaceae bacterium]|nr:DNA polymerase III subunit [Chitinispirillaceae bacterium]
MPHIPWPHWAGQQRVKDVLSSAIANGTVGHAYLFSGSPGSGTFAAALDLSLALLCKNQSSRPCLACSSCMKLLHYANPDFRVIMPVVLEKEHKKDGVLTEEGWKHVASCVKDRLSSPYLMPDHAKVPGIPVEWVREINQTLQRGAVEGDTSIVVIDGIDMMNKESANSMLKLLEEPPRGTVMLLLTDRIPAVLPTIVSRCQILRFPFMSPGELREELCRRLSLDAADERLERILYTGSLGRSLQAWADSAGDSAAEAVRFWDLCATGAWNDIAPFIDRIAVWGDVSRYERMFVEIMERMQNTYLGELPGSDNVFSDNRSRKLRFDGSCTRERVEQVLDQCQRSIDAIRARAGSALVFANFAAAVAREFHGKKQQAG